MLRQALIQGTRWMLVPGAGILAYVVGLYTFIALAVFLPFPPPLAEPTGGFVMGLLVVLATATSAPSHQVGIAIVAMAGAITASSYFERNFTLSSGLGSVCAVALVAWWFHPRRTARSVVWVGRFIAALLMVYLGVVYGFHKHWFARPSGVPSPLTHILGTNTQGVFYEYQIGGHLIDSESLWRIETKPEILERIVAELELKSTNSVPRTFWRMPPYYWPRSMPPGGEAFQSRFFTAAERGHDGNHYFLLLNKSQGRAFVWAKFNF